MTVMVYRRDALRALEEWQRKVDEAMTRHLEDPNFIRALEAEPDIKKREAMVRERCEAIKRESERARAEMDASLLARAIDVNENGNESAPN